MGIFDFKKNFQMGLTVWKSIFMVPVAVIKKDKKPSIRKAIDASILRYPIGFVKGAIKSITFPILLIAIIGILILIFWKRIEKIFVS